MKEEPSGAYVHQTLLRHDGRPCSHLLHHPAYHKQPLNTLWDHIINKPLAFRFSPAGLNQPTIHQVQ